MLFLDTSLCKVAEERRVCVACGRDRLVAKQVAAKLSSMEDYIRQLQTSQSFIKQHQKARQARDQLTKF